MTYHEQLKQFVNNDCVGKQYDSCKNSPCTYASASGCTHPNHPKFKIELPIKR